MKFWLMKSEPDEFSIDDLVKAPRQTTPCFGVRNYTARNFMRDDMRVGDGVLFYHSSCPEPGIAGLAKVASAPYPDESQFDAKAVFSAAAEHGTAIEINSRPERRDPPTRLIELARDLGCLFSIDSDAHAPGQLDFLWYGAERAEAAGIDPDRIVNTWPKDRLLAWANL